MPMRLGWASCKTMSCILVTRLFSWKDGRPWTYLWVLCLSWAPLSSTSLR